jgi:hypothetical protein
MAVLTHDEVRYFDPAPLGAHQSLGGHYWMASRTPVDFVTFCYEIDRLGAARRPLKQ